MAARSRRDKPAPLVRPRAPLIKAENEEFTLRQLQGLLQRGDNIQKRANKAGVALLFGFIGIVAIGLTLEIENNQAIFIIALILVYWIFRHR